MPLPLYNTLAEMTEMAEFHYWAKNAGLPPHPSRRLHPISPITAEKRMLVISANSAIIFDRVEIRKVSVPARICLTPTKYSVMLDSEQVNPMIVLMIIETIRRHIEKCGETRYRISKESGVGEDQLCRIMQGRTCTVETADKLFKYFGLTIAKKKKRM